MLYSGIWALSNSVQPVITPWHCHIRSTAVEVALKMAFRKFLADQGELDEGDQGTQGLRLRVLGLQVGHGAHHIPLLQLLVRACKQSEISTDPDGDTVSIPPHYWKSFTTCESDSSPTHPSPLPSWKHTR